jgi:phosphatidylinositol alpha-1,6-mannosyltransferase
VLLLTPDFPPERGGIQLTSARLAQWLPACDVHIVTRQPPGGQEHDDHYGLSVRRVRRDESQRLSIARLNAEAVPAGLRVRPEVVLCMHVAVAPASALLKRIARVPVVLYLHGMELPVRPRLTRYAFRCADLNIAVSSFTRDLAVKLDAPAEKIRIINAGVDLPDAFSLPGVADRNHVVAIGTLTFAYKGHDVLLRALALVRHRIPEARLTIIGDGPLRGALESLALELGVGDAVHFAGSVSDEERDAVLCQATVFALPSRISPDGQGGEGFGIAYLEAAARGIPAVGGEAGGASDAVLDGETGLLVDARDPYAVAGAITRLLMDENLARSLGEAARKRAQQFGWPRVAQRVRGVLAEVAEPGT